MPPKEQQSKKAVKEKKERVIDDATFGLKNKNKSKKVQQFIDRVEKTVKNGGGGADAVKAKEAKKELKLAKQLQEEELRVLFNEGITGQFGKKKSASKTLAAEMGIDQTNKDVADLLEAMSSDSEGSGDDGEGGGERRKVLYLSDDEPAAVEVFREKTIEDIIEEQRAKLTSEGKVGTPVTAASFAVWRAGKMAQRQAEAEARFKAEQTKKRGGKGLSVLSGKELFNFNASLFVDDEAAIDATEENALNAETRQDLALEEAKAAQEAERAQAEQMRLMEAHRLEVEERERRDAERRRLAAIAAITFMLGNVTINQVVFDDDEKEDLEPFVGDDDDEEENSDEGGCGSDEEEDEDEEDEDDDRDGEEEEEEEAAGAKGREGEGGYLYDERGGSSGGGGGAAFATDS